MTTTADASKTLACPHCGLVHVTMCPRIQAIEYYADGMLKRIEFRADQRSVSEMWSDYHQRMIEFAPLPT